MTIEERPVLEQLAESVKWWNSEEAEEPDVRRLFAACKAEIERLQARLRDEEERHALLQSRCYEGFASATDVIFDALQAQYEGFASATDVIFDALQAQDDQVEVLRDALELLIQVVEHANQGAFDNGVYGPEGQNEGVYLASRAVDGARAALRCAEGEGFGKCP